MNLLRGWLLDNLGLKLTALLLALLVYLNVFTDRPATMLVSFPIEFADLPDSLTLSGPAPASVQAELRGTGKQLIGVRVREPRLRISLAGAGVGRYERAIAASDLPMPGGGVALENLVGPRVVALEIDRRVHRDVPVTLHVEGAPAPGFKWVGTVALDPPVVRLTGPRAQLLAIDSLALTPVRLDGHRDTLKLDVMAERMPDWSAMDPPLVHVRVPVVRAGH